MELYQLRYFVEVARRENITHAAKHLNLAQPALSQQIRNLEEELGAALLARRPRKVTLTPAGEVLLREARSLLSMADATRDAVAEVNEVRRGRLVVATIPTVSACWLPDVIKKFRGKYPRLELILREASSAGVMTEVEEGGAELGFLQLPAPSEKFRIRPLKKERFVMLVPQDHAFAGEGRIPLSRFRGEPFILFKGQVREVTLSACRSVGFEPRVACETGQLETVRALVKAHLGVALLPELAVATLSQGLRGLEVKGSGLTRTVALISRKEQTDSAAAKAWVETLKEGVR